MKILAALFALLIAAPLAAQDAPAEPKRESIAKVVKIENGKVVELEGEEAEKAIKEVRERMKEFERDMDDQVRKAMEEMAKSHEEMEKQIKETMERLLKQHGEEGGLGGAVNKQLREALEKARKAVDAALKKAGDGDVDIEHEETSEDGRTQVRIKIVRKVVKSGGAEGESPKETPETPKEEPRKQ